MATVIEFCNRCEERKYLKLCKKCTQYLCADCKRQHPCGISLKLPTLYSPSEHLIKETDNKPFECRAHLKEVIRFCFTCTAQLCEDCLDKVQTEHKGHVIYNVANAAKEIRKQTETKIASLKEEIKKARKQKHELDKQRFSSSERRTCRREVSNLASNLASAIVAAIEDHHRLDKTVVAESVTKLQNTVDVWMDMNRSLHKISTAYNDLDTIHLFRKFKQAQESPIFPPIKTKAEFPDARRFEHSELIQTELKSLMDFLESLTGINVPLVMKTEEEIERLATAYDNDQADISFDLATNPPSRAPSRLSVRTNITDTTALSKSDVDTVKYIKSENQALKAEIRKLRKQTNEMVHATSLLANYCNHVMDFTLMQEEDILDTLKKPATDDDELSDFYKNISSVGHTFAKLKSHGLSLEDNTIGSLGTLNHNMDDTQSIQTRLTFETQTISIIETANATVNDKVSQSQMTRESKRNRKAVNIVSMYSRLYENEWADALDTLTQSAKRWPMDLVIKHLYTVIKTCYKVCKGIAAQQLQDLVDTIFLSNGGRTLPLADIKPIMDIRRQTAVSTSINIKQHILNMEEFKLEFNKHTFSKFQLLKEIYDTPFFGKCIYLCWCMVLEDPPLYLDKTPPRNSVIDKDLYREYTKGGKRVDYCVWPPLLLTTDGEILAKGVVQAY